MATAVQIPPPHVRWNLGDLYSSPEDLRIEQTWARLRTEAEHFAAAYRGKINSADLTASALAEAIRRLEEISQEASKPINYAQLYFVADTGNPAAGAFLQKQTEKTTELSVLLMFFELELQAMPEERLAPILADSALDRYRHYVQVTRSYSPYRLSEPEEIVLEEASNTGARAWVRFFEEVTANHVFRYSPPDGGSVQELNQEQVLSLLREPDRQVRQAAADCFSDGLRQLQRVLVFTYNTLLQDKSVSDRLRKMPYPEHSRHLSNELSRETVDLVVSMCHQRYNLVERFYNVKRQILGLAELTHIDRYAPLFPAEEPIDYDNARRIVLDSFGTFSMRMRECAEEFFVRSWIDAEPRQGKQGGAFCAYISPDLHPYVLVNYLNKVDDVMTLAHELGHGVHAYLSREQSYFNFHGTLPLAELASTFGEMLVFESLVSGASLKDKLAMYGSKIEGIFATVFRQAAMYRFETRSHEKRRAEGEIPPQEFGDMWQEEMQAMFGNAVKLGEQHRDWWLYIGHFYAVPFYVYAYSFGELLVMSLFEMSKAEGPEFSQKYIDLLRQGGSKSPQELMESVGIDLNSESFWDGGFRAMERLVSEFERLWAEYSRA